MAGRNLEKFIIGETMDLQFKKLTETTPEIAESLSRWENDPALIPFIRPNSSKEALEQREPVTISKLAQRLDHDHIYLIYMDGQLVGEMNYQVDPSYLFKKEPGTAWIGIVIGEESARGKGVGFHAIRFLEEEIKAQGLKRIELGVFEFNTNAIKLYERMGYKEIAHIDGFTFWENKMWQDIRMEKYL
jgi:RimJ/RimL family protein N-acetyltransferase